MTTSLPEPPYVVVIFTSRRTGGDQGYGAMSARMMELVKDQPGFLGVESARNAEGFGITVSYWKDLASIAAWKAHLEHREAMKLGRERWYEAYDIKVGTITSHRMFEAP